MVYYILGFLSASAIGIFIWTISKGKGETLGTIKDRTDTNNTDIRSGLDGLGENNRESGRIIAGAETVAGDGLKDIKDTRRAVSDIIGSSIGDEKKESD